MSESLFDRIGGIEAIMAAAEIFYEKVLEDDHTRPFFDDIDVSKQTKKLVGFMAWAFGGPDEYKGRDLRTAHKDLVRKRGLDDSHFDAVATHLVATLNELGVQQSLIDEAVGIVAGTRDEVLDR